ncbi:MAG: aminodeoxychorismate synthase component I, partial [Planctomycetes bacterium]|nr:aminodeoxychorismate synthase component I [Planctomycetota bacterium]
AHWPFLLFLDSAGVRPPQGRYSYVTAAPFRRLISRRGRVETMDRRGTRSEWADPFHVLARNLSSFPLPTITGLPPFQGGAAGLFGYDLCHYLERLPRPAYDEFQVPDLAVGFYDWVIPFDHSQNRAWLVSTGLPARPERRPQRAARRLRQVLRALSLAHVAGEGSTRSNPGLARSDLCPQFFLPSQPTLSSNFDRAGYLAAVQRAIDYIHAGDCFQVNLSQRLLSPVTLPPLDLYGRLRERNPAPFAGYFDLGEFVIASASPERFLRVDRGEVETYPIKGTRPRGGTPEEDRAVVEELLHSAKDRAENIMIVDLLRNDLGRVCRYGSVRVPAVCRLQSFPYVHHLVSEVRGRLREGLTSLDLLRAAFPGGSVTGAPKIRAMEIIAELEPTARGPYCGSLGYLGFDGSLDTNILIRTFTMGRGWVQFPVGGGIVADSLPEREYEETWHKAQGLLQALDAGRSSSGR